MAVHGNDRADAVIALDIVLLTVIALLSHLLMPYWWWVMLLPLLYGLFFHRSAKHVCWVSASSMMLIWLLGCLNSWLGGGTTIMSRVATALGLGGSLVLFVVTLLVAGIAAMSAAGLGYGIRKAINRPALDR